MKKLMVSVLAFITLVFCACTSSDKSLAEHGMDVVSLMSEMLESEDYSNVIISSANNYKELSDKIASGDYSDYKAVYEISFDTRSTAELFYSEELNLSDRLTEYLNDNSMTAFSSYLNSSSKEGVSALAVSSIYCANKIFVKEDIKDNKLYLYTFESGAPIVVSFIVGEQGAVRAVGNFIICDEDEDEVEYIKQKLSPITADITFEKIK